MCKEICNLWRKNAFGRLNESSVINYGTPPSWISLWFNCYLPRSWYRKTKRFLTVPKVKEPMTAQLKTVSTWSCQVFKSTVTVELEIDLWYWTGMSWMLFTFRTFISCIFSCCFQHDKAYISGLKLEIMNLQSIWRLNIKLVNIYLLLSQLVFV